jgi:hypothetical protein
MPLERSFDLRYTIPMKLDIILQSNIPEHVWNAFCLGITALKVGHQTECEEKRFDIKGCFA